jgi:hypothetical protein
MDTKLLFCQCTKCKGIVEFKLVDIPEGATVMNLGNEPKQPS